MIKFKNILNEALDPKLVYRGIRIEYWNSIKEAGYLKPRKDQIYTNEEPAVWFTPNLSYAVHYAGDNNGDGIVVAMLLDQIASTYKYKCIEEGFFHESILVFDKIPLSDLVWIKKPVFSEKEHYSYDEKFGDTLIDL